MSTEIESNIESMASLIPAKDTNKVRVRLVYPENRIVSGKTVMCWAEDALENGETTEKAASVEDAVRILSDLGHITVPANGII